MHQQMVLPMVQMVMPMVQMVLLLVQPASAKQAAPGVGTKGSWSLMLQATSPQTMLLVWACGIGASYAVPSAGV